MQADLSSFRWIPLFCLSLALYFSQALICTSGVSGADIDFEKQVAPILVQNCLKCHNPVKARAGLDLSTRELAVKGSDAGEVLIPGKPEESLLLKRAEDGSMPPEADGRRLTVEEVALLTAWVKAGAKWPEGRVLSPAANAAAAGAVIPTEGIPRGVKRSLVRRRVWYHFHSRRNLPAAE